MKYPENGTYVDIKTVHEEEYTGLYVDKALYLPDHKVLSFSLTTSWSITQIY